MANATRFQRGDIVRVNLEPVRGREMQGATIGGLWYSVKPASTPHPAWTMPCLARR